MLRARIVFSAVAFVFIFVCSTACGPRINPQVSVPDVSLPPGLSADRRAKGAEVYVDTVLDSRPTNVVTSYKSVNAQFATDIAPTVRRAIEGVFKQKGLSIREKAPVIVNVEVKQWSAQFSADSSSKVDSQAELYLEVIGPANRKIYSGTYKGFSSFEGSPFDNKQLEDLLRTAMNEAVRQLVYDQGLLDTVTAF